MAIDPVSAGLGGVSLISGMMGGKSAKKAADKARGKAQSLIDRKTGLFDAFLKMVKDYDAQGGFNPDKLVKQASDDINYQSGLDQGNSAAASRTLGYNIGDTQPLKRISSISQGFKLKFADLANQIRTGAFTNKLGAYGSVPAHLLDSGIAAHSGRAAQQGAQASSMNPASFLTSAFSAYGQSQNAPMSTPPTVDPRMQGGFPSRSNGFRLPEYGTLPGLVRRY